MDNKPFSLTKLWPEFGKVLEDGGIHSSEGFAALIVIILIAIAGIFLLWALVKALKAVNKTRFYKKMLKGVRLEELGHKRRDLLNASAQKKGCEELWKEFDESLVVDGDGQLHNTFDAAHFFNTHTLAQGLTENRLLAAVPGFLTALGVIGTFAGLQMGLANLDLATEANTKELREGISVMIGGAAVAFLTSVWGVSSSVMFNILEKSMERYVRRGISGLQDRIDYLYPRMTAEGSLAKIADYSESSDEILQGLAERIGIRMQEAMTQATTSMQEGLEASLTKVLQPAIETLVSNANQGSERALETLLERFMDGVGSAGEDQKNMMESAALDMRKSTEGLGLQLNGFLSELREQTEQSTVISSEQQRLLQERLQQIGEDSRDQQRSLSTHFDELIEDLTKRMRENNDVASEQDSARQQRLEDHFKSILDSSNQAVDSLSAQVNANIQHQQERDESRHVQFEQQIDGMKKNQDELVSQVQGLTRQQQDLFASVVDRLEGVQEGFSALISANEKASTNVRESALEMNSVSTHLGVLATNLRAASNSLAEEVRGAIEAVEAVSRVTEAVTNKTDHQIDALATIGKQFSDVSDGLGEAANSAESGYQTVASHYQQLQTKLESHLKDVQQQVSELLQNFSLQAQSQVQERMNEWNGHTREFTGTMTTAIEAMAGVVDEIESKVARPEHSYAQ